MTGAIKSALFRQGEEKTLKGYINEDYLEMLQCIMIVSLDNEDPLNWKNLHL